MFGRKPEKSPEKGFTHRVLESIAQSVDADYAEPPAGVQYKEALQCVASLALSMHERSKDMLKSGLLPEDNVAFDKLTSQQSALMLISASLAVNNSKIALLKSSFEETLVALNDKDPVRDNVILDITGNEAVIHLRPAVEEVQVSV